MTWPAIVNGLQMANALRPVSMVVWSAVTAMLLPGAWRVLRHRPRYLDPLWAALALLPINRIAFSIAYIGAPQMLVWCQASAIVAGLIFTAVAWQYLRHDR